MKTIKTRNSVKNIKVLDKGVNLSKRMKDAYTRTKERAEETQSPNHATPTEYASENIQDTAQGAARDTVYHLQNPRQKARDNLNNAKGHFEEVKRNMPKERQRAAEQAQKMAHKTKANAENLRKNADKAGETAHDAKTAVKDAKRNLKEVRQHGKNTLREVKQKARFESRGRSIKIKEFTVNTPAGDIPRPTSGTVNPSPKGGAPSPTYLSKGVQAPKSAGDMAKTLQSSAKSTGKAVKSTSKGVKETAKGTIKTAKKSVKTAEKSAKAAVKMAQRTAKTAQKTATAAAKTAKAAERAARAAAKTAVQTAKAAAKAVAALVKAAIAAVKGLVAAIAAGGWMVVLVIIIICMVGLLVSSVFGIFFSSESGVSENGLTMNAVVAQIDAEFSDELERIISDNYHDDYDITGVCADWKEVLAVYAVKTNTDADNPLDVMTLDDEKIELLRTVFWDMNIIDYWIEEIYHPDTDADDDEDDSWTEYILHITVTSKTAAEMAGQYGFNAKQREMLDELLKPEYDSLWSAVLADALEGGPNRTHDHIAELLAGDDTTFVGGGFASPIAGDWRSMVSCEFGTGYAGHTGMDIAIPIGTEIQAVAAGKVLYTQMSSSGYGYHVVINHGGGIVTLYAHCSRILVSAGQEVSQGDVIALSGNTGNVIPRPTPENPTAGAHLHIEFIVDGVPKNPRSYLP